MKLYYFAVLSFLSYCVSSHAATLEEIATFAAKICNQSIRGSETSATIEENLNGDVNGLAKALGIKVGSDGLVKHDGTHYDGIPKEKLPKEIPTEAQCRADLAKILIEERQRLNAAKQSPAVIGNMPTKAQILDLLGDFEPARRAQGAAMLAKLGSQGTETLVTFLSTYKQPLAEINRYQKLDAESYLQGVLAAAGIPIDVRDAAVIETLRAAQIPDNVLADVWLGLKPRDDNVSQALAAAAHYSQHPTEFKSDGTCATYFVLNAFDATLSNPGPKTYAVLRRTIETGPPWTLCLVPLLDLRDPDNLELVQKAVGRQLSHTRIPSYTMLSEGAGYLFIEPAIHYLMGIPGAMAPVVSDIVRCYTANLGFEGAFRRATKEVDPRVVRFRKLLLEAIAVTGTSTPEDAVEILIPFVEKQVSWDHDGEDECELLGVFVKLQLNNNSIRTLYSTAANGDLTCARDMAVRAELKLGMDIDGNKKLLLHILTTSYDPALRDDIVAALAGHAEPKQVMWALEQRLANLEMYVHNSRGEPIDYDIKGKQIQIESIQQELAAITPSAAGLIVEHLKNDLHALGKDSKSWETRLVSEQRVGLIGALGLMKSDDPTVISVLSDWMFFVPKDKYESDFFAPECGAAAQALQRLSVADRHLIHRTADAFLARTIPEECLGNVAEFLAAHRSADAYAARALRIAARSDDWNFSRVAEHALATTQ